jgi:coenzyme F420-0:L-glutamate ligase/coenzyme F420-1:gamma-L-glutamate ligase
MDRENRSFWRSEPGRLQHATMTACEMTRRSEADRRAWATFLSRQRVAHLATADAAGRPHVIPIVYAVGGGVLYTAIDAKPKRTSPERLRRIRNILANPRAAVVADTYSEDWSSLAYVLVEGPAHILEGGPEYERALRLLREKYPQYRAMNLDGLPVIAIRIERIVGWTAL